MITLLFCQPAGCVDPRTVAGLDSRAPNEPAVVVDVFNEARKVFSDVLEGFESRRVDGFDLNSSARCPSVGILSDGDAAGPVTTDVVP